MILLDTNLLIYSFVASMREHDRTRDWLDEQLGTGIRVGMSWASLGSFLRVVTNARVFASPVPIASALDQIEAWLGHSGVWTPVQSTKYAHILRDLVYAGDVKGDLVPDAMLAALAIDNGLTLCSADRDFARFPGLRWINPLAL